MKTNLRMFEVNGKETKNRKKAFWYSWDETCDCCGKKRFDKDDVQVSEYPNMEEEDLCVDCLSKKISEIAEKRRKNSIFKK